MTHVRLSVQLPVGAMRHAPNGIRDTSHISNTRFTLHMCCLNLNRVGKRDGKKWLLLKIYDYVDFKE